MLWDLFVDALFPELAIFQFVFTFFSSFHGYRHRNKLQATETKIQVISSSMPKKLDGPLLTYDTLSEQQDYCDDVKQENFEEQHKSMQLSSGSTACWSSMTPYMRLQFFTSPKSITTSSIFLAETSPYLPQGEEQTSQVEKREIDDSMECLSEFELDVNRPSHRPEHDKSREACEEQKIAGELEQFLGNFSDSNIQLISPFMNPALQEFNNNDHPVIEEADLDGQELITSSPSQQDEEEACELEVHSPVSDPPINYVLYEVLEEDEPLDSARDFRDEQYCSVEELTFTSATREAREEQPKQTEVPNDLEQLCQKDDEEVQVAVQIEGQNLREDSIEDIQEEHNKHEVLSEKEEEVVDQTETKIEESSLVEGFDLSIDLLLKSITLQVHPPELLETVLISSSVSSTPYSGSRCASRVSRQSTQTSMEQTPTPKAEAILIGPLDEQEVILRFLFDSEFMKSTSAPLGLELAIKYTEKYLSKTKAVTALIKEETTSEDCKSKAKAIVEWQRSSIRKILGESEEQQQQSGADLELLVMSVSIAYSIALVYGTEVDDSLIRTICLLFQLEKSESEKVFKRFGLSVPKSLNFKIMQKAVPLSAYKAFLKAAAGEILEKLKKKPQKKMLSFFSRQATFPSVKLVAEKASEAFNNIQIRMEEEEFSSGE